MVRYDVVCLTFSSPPLTPERGVSIIKLSKKLVQTDVLVVTVVSSGAIFNLNFSNTFKFTRMEA